MTATATPVETTAPERPPVPIRRALRDGSLAGLAMAFVAAIGMLEAFDTRTIVAPVLSLGYLALYWPPIVFGYRAAHRPTVEGLPVPPRDRNQAVTGALVGLVAGVVLAAFIALTDAFDVREVFPRVGPRMIELLTLGWGVGPGIAWTVAVSTLLGLGGGALNLLPTRWARALAAAGAWIFAVAVFDTVVSQVFRELGLGQVRRILYHARGGVTVPTAVVVGIVAAASTLRPGRERGPGFVSRLTQAEGRERVRLSVIAALIVAAVTIGLPIVLGSLLNELLVNVGLFLLMAIGLNIVVGFAGLLDLGYVAFFAVGAYTTAVLTSPISPRWTPELSWWAALPVVLVLAAIAGVLVGTPVIRMRGDYLAIVTLGFGEIVRILFLSDWLAPYFGGAQGVRVIPGVPIPGGEINGTTTQSMLYLTLVFVALAAYASWRLQNSRIGRAWAALREDETVAAAMGIDIVGAKLLAFVSGAIIAAFGGALFAAKVGSVFPNSFALLVSIIVLVVVIVGGMGHIPGVTVGAVVLIGILGGPTQPGLLSEFQEYKLLIYGALLIYMMLKRPEGLVPSVRRSRELHQQEFLQDAWLTTGEGSGQED